jgi:hypothetical protein
VVEDTAERLVVDEQHRGAFAEQLRGIIAASTELPLIAANSRTSSTALVYLIMRAWVCGAAESAPTCTLRCEASV